MAFIDIGGMVPSIPVASQVLWFKVVRRQSVSESIGGSQ